MSERLRVGVIGAGLVAQWEHIPNLLRLCDRFTVAGVCDPSAEVRDFVGRRFGVPTFADSDALLGKSLDAVVIASPDQTHLPETLKALSRGLHVFCEKPLCYGPAHAEEIIAARDRAGMVVQVGYMKRFDPAYEVCLDVLPHGAGRLIYVSVEVHDPDSWPFAEVHPHALSSDLPQELMAAGAAQRSGQIAAALGFKPTEDLERSFAGRYCSSLVHDVNATLGLLDRIGIPDGVVIGAAAFANGKGGSGTVRLLDGQAVWQMTHLVVPAVADYGERIALYFEDCIVELRFPSPYLNHFPTRLVVRRSEGTRLHTQEIRPGFGEAFIRELEAFWSSIVTGAPVRNTVEQARRDQSLLCAMARHVSGRPVQEETDAVGGGSAISGREAGGKAVA